MDSPGHESTSQIYRSKSAQLMDAESVLMPPDSAVSNHDYNNEDDINNYSTKYKDRKAYRSPRDIEDDRASALSLVNTHQAELTRYRETIHTQRTEIQTLRRRLLDLETTNSELRRQLNGFSELKRVSAESEEEIQRLDKRELAAKYNSLVSRHSRQVSEVKDYRDKVILLQQELIRKNQETKELLEEKKGRGSGLIDGLSSKREAELEERLTERNKKVKILEQLVRNQEKTMARMEKMLQSKKENKQARLDEDNLEIENSRLRKALQELSNLSRALDRGLNQEEFLMRQERLEKAESRVRALEQQLSDDARRWSHERTDLLLWITELERSQQRPQSEIFDEPWSRYKTPTKNEPASPDSFWGTVQSRGPATPTQRSERGDLTPRNQSRGNTPKSETSYPEWGREKQDYERKKMTYKYGV